MDHSASAVCSTTSVSEQTSTHSAGGISEAQNPTHLHRVEIEEVADEDDIPVASLLPPSRLRPLSPCSTLMKSGPLSLGSGRAVFHKPQPHLRMVHVHMLSPSTSSHSQVYATNKSDWALLNRGSMAAHLPMMIQV